MDIVRTVIRIYWEQDWGKESFQDSCTVPVRSLESSIQKLEECQCSGTRVRRCDLLVNRCFAPSYQEAT
jgi:hypothetical protein